MDLEFLDGLEGEGSKYNTRAALEEIGRLIKKNKEQRKTAASQPARRPVFAKKTTEQKQASKEKRQAVAKKVGRAVNVVNKVNPATVLFRAGLLASMKLNVMKVAERLKWAYATPEQAARYGMDVSKLGKLKTVLARAEKLFFNAGGKPENLKQAILTGKGNVNRELSGTHYGYNEKNTLAFVLGEVYASEFVEGMEEFQGFGRVRSGELAFSGWGNMSGLGELGEPATTAASLAAASGAMTALAALLASVGTLFIKKSDVPANKKAPKQKAKPTFKRPAPKQAAKPAPAPQEENNPYSEPETPQETPAAEYQAPDSEGESNSETENNAEPNSNEPENQGNENEENNAEENSGEENPAANDTNDQAENEEGTEGLTGSDSKSFYQSNKHWILPLGFFAAGIATTLVFKRVFGEDSRKKKKGENETVASDLNGTGEPPDKSETKEEVHGVVELM